MKGRGHMSNQRENLLKRITTMDFMATDLHLYLNTHPNDKEALKMFNDVNAKNAQVKKEYEEQYGPLTGYRTADTIGETTGTWRWSEGPWPWQKDFNFNWTEEV